MKKRFESMWAIRPEAVMTVIKLLARDTNGQGPVALGTGKVEIGATAWEASKPTTRGAGTHKVAVIPIQGVLTSDGPSYYGTNYATIADAAEKAANDPDVKRIILSVDSPGGEVTGLPETAAVLAAVAKVKPISAIVEGAAASAAYWLTSQASDITLTPSGEVGSVGVRMMHVDVSKMLEDEGYKITELHSGEFKTEWSPYHVLTGEAKADMQVRLDASHKDFTGAIASGRGSRVTAAMRTSRYGGGRMFSADAALSSGLVDKIQSTRDFYKGVMGTASVPRGGFAPSTQRARLELERLKHTS